MNNECEESTTMPQSVEFGFDRLVVYTYNPGSTEAEVGPPWAWGKFGLYRKTLSQNKSHDNNSSNNSNGNNTSLFESLWGSSHIPEK